MPKDWTVKQKLASLGFDAESVPDLDPTTAIGVELATVLLNVLENPDAPQADKTVARETIIEAIRLSRR
jgi:Fe-S-cluster formation regulator IscX/YfhJ